MKIQSHPLTGHIMLAMIVFFAAFMVLVSHWTTLERKKQGCGCDSSQDLSWPLESISPTPPPQSVHELNLTANAPTAEDAAWSGWMVRTQLSMAQLRGDQ